MPLRQEQGAPVEQRVARRGRAGRRGRAQRGLGDGPHSGRAVPVARPHRGPERLEVRLASQADGHRLEASGRVGQTAAPPRPRGTGRRRSVRAASRRGRARARRAPRRRPRRAVSAPRRAHRHRAWRWPPPAAACARRDGSGDSVAAALQERGGGGEPAAGLRAARGALQLRGDPFVRSRRRLGQVPRATVRVDLRIGRLRQREVHRLALLRRGRPVDRRAHERVTEPSPARRSPAAPRSRRRPPPEPDAELLGRAPHQQRVADRLRRRHQQQQPRVLAGAPRVAARKLSSIRPGRGMAPSRARTRPPAASRSAPAAAPAGPAGCRASRRRAGRGRARRAGPG